MKGLSRSRGELSLRGRWSPVYRRLALPVQAFLQTEALSGFVLLAAAVVAILWANSPWGESYVRFRHQHLVLDLGVVRLDESVQHWVNDALMAIFFFVAGLEIKRELVAGALSSLKQAALPVVAALGGMIVPAGIYIAVNAGTKTVHGWGVPMATDIAFSVGVLALVGERLPGQVRILLLALAIVDDIGAILVIAAFYSQGIVLAGLIWALVVVGAILVLRLAGFREVGLMLALGVLLWLAVYQSGFHATLAGVILGLLTPSGVGFDHPSFARSAREMLDAYEDSLALGNVEQAEVLQGALEVLCRETESPLDRLERWLHPWSSYVILPLFALVNAGVVLSRHTLAAAVGSRVALGIAAGLVLGKTAGVFGFSWAAARLGLCQWPRRVSHAHILGLAMLAGIGFTVSLFITELAFPVEADRDAAKIGILAASVLAGILGYAYLRMKAKEKAA